MRVMSKGYRFTISYLLLAIAVILAFVRMEAIANESVAEACRASREAQNTVVALVHALVNTSSDPTNKDLLDRRDRVLDRIELRDCSG